MKNLPLISIIVVNCNGREYLKECLSSIVKNNYSNYEVIIVDNHSTDGSIEYLKSNFYKYKNIKIIRLDKNYGPAKARNEGVKLASGDYLGFLDNDTKVDQNWISNALEKFLIDDNIGALQCKLLQFDKKSYDYAGEYITNLGFLKQVAKYGEIDQGQHDSVINILAAKSAAMFIRKEDFKKIGGFDEDYFIFLEETDLGWRLWLNNKRVVFCPNSIVYHRYSSSKEIFDKNYNNYLIRFHGTKNYILTLIKNLSLFNLVKILPINLFLWISLAIYLFVKGNLTSFKNIIKGIVWNIYNLKHNCKKRRNIQHNRKINDEQLFIKYELLKEISIKQYINKFFTSQRSMKTSENL